MVGAVSRWPELAWFTGTHPMHLWFLLRRTTAARPCQDVVRGLSITVVCHFGNLLAIHDRAEHGVDEVITMINANDNMTNQYDVVVIGGGAAGLSGALLLARSRRSVLVTDAGQPRNAPATGVHGLLSRDGINPVELLERGRADVRGSGACW